MNSPKTDSYLDTASLEKGCCQAQPLFPGPELHHTCPAGYVRHTSSRRVFMKGFSVACGVMALAWIVFSHANHVLRLLNHGPGRLWADGEGGYAPPDGEPQHCIGSTNWTTYYDRPSWSTGYPYGAETAFTLPVNADTLYLLARGLYQQGSVEIDQSTETTDTVGVRVRVAYYYDEALDRATVCRLERPENEHGVAIITPTKQPRYNFKDQLRFDVKLTLPAGSDSALQVKNLETDMPNYSQSVGDLWESVLFDKFLSYLPMVSVTSESGQFSSSNGGISGHFNAGSSLALKTSNGAITSSVTLLHREGADASKLSMYTTNGRVDSEVALTTDSVTGGEFEVDTESTRGSIGLTFTDSPVDSVLKCRAETTIGSLLVALDSAYEGSYSLQNTLGSQTVEQRRVEDPAGKGRHRAVSVNRSRGRVSGSVNWVESDGSTGNPGSESSAVLKTTLASMKLLI
ncbi:hypothetical protein PAXINDRAFT_169030 [Paxillus involutus ATCC 200175]|uniref:Uncharacterized protein n=1 Tax=Paxillus involutus ATCC 200175 TaxID=664439 RepID=A0A0C9U856_PAXIN|nr:hypothetical protein PAXINDRAFT_169030 [Paxillus involutus ATCC 200175]